MVPARPQRVYVARVDPTCDAVLLLGAPLVGFGNFTGDPRPNYPWLKGTAFDHAIEVSIDKLPSAEKMMALKPDLVIVSDAMLRLTDELAIYRQVAPVVAVDTSDNATLLRTVGQATGHEQQAESGIATVQQDLKGFTPSWRPTSLAMFTAFEPGDVYIHVAEGKGALIGRLVSAAGLTPLTPRRAPDGGSWLQQVSLERIGQYLATDLLIGVDDGSSSSAYDALEKEPVFSALAPVRAGRYRRTKPELGQAINNGGSPLSLPYALDEFRRILAETKH